jgi:hypothetical protein
MIKIKRIIKRENALYILIALAVFAVVISALLNDRDVKHVAQETLHEIRTFDMWKQSAYVNPRICQYPARGLTNAAFIDAPPIMEGERPPRLVKELGVEVVPVVGGKAKITGVMGDSWADKAGLRRGDIILRFDRKKITSLQYFLDVVAKAAPEKDYKINVLRGGRVKSFLVTVGEGEMEGFTQITPARYVRPANVR